MKKKVIHPGDDVWDALMMMEYEELDQVVVGRIEQQLDSDLYKKVKQTLLAMGGIWDTKLKGTVFLLGRDPRKMISNRAAGITVEKDGFYATPDSVIAMMVEKADLKITPETRICEPQAGSGAICNYLVENCGVQPSQIDVMEINPVRQWQLRTVGYNVVGSDFLACQAGAYDYILMNPPFESQVDIQHVQHAFEHFLKPGGCQVSLMCDGKTWWGDDQVSQNMRGIIDRWGTKERLPEGSFAHSGTGTSIDVVMITLRKPGNYLPGSSHFVTTEETWEKPKPPDVEVEYEDPRVIVEQIRENTMSMLSILDNLADMLGDMPAAQEIVQEMESALGTMLGEAPAEPVQPILVESEHAVPEDDTAPAAELIIEKPKRTATKQTAPIQRSLFDLVLENT